MSTVTPWPDDETRLDGERANSAEPPFYGCHVLSGVWCLDLEYRAGAADDRGPDVVPCRN